MPQKEGAYPSDSSPTEGLLANQAVGCGICGPEGVMVGISAEPPGIGASDDGWDGTGIDGGRLGNSGPGLGGFCIGGVSAGAGAVGGNPGSSGGGRSAGSDSRESKVSTWRLVD